MRILVVSPSDPQLLPFAEGIIEELKIWGHETELVTVTSFFRVGSYFERKMTKWGIKKFEQRYTNGILTDWEVHSKNLNPDFVLVLCGVHITPPLREFLKQYKMILWLWDHFQRFDVLETLTEFASEVFCFEYSDVKTIHEKYNIPTHYLPLGVNEKIYHPAECEKDIDVSFIGWMSKRRIDVLEKVCERGYKENWALKIGGYFYDDRHFWKKYFFARKHKYLSKFAENKILDPHEIAKLYCRSKICLNINVAEHHGLNPRTFEILATKSFELMNAGQDAHGLLNLETDLATFDGPEDVAEKISFYLANEDLREKIALAGYNAVIKNCTIKRSVEKVLTESETIKSLNLS